MKRTQIYFPTDLYHALETQARRQRVSVSEVIRQTIKKDLSEQQPAFLLTDLVDIAQNVRGGKNISNAYKKILYENKYVGIC